MSRVVSSATKASLYAASALALSAPSFARAQAPPDSRVADLEARVDQLTRELSDLKAALKAQAQRATPAAAASIPAPTTQTRAAATSPSSPGVAGAANTPATAAWLTAQDGKFGMRSADGRFSANLHGMMQFDAVHYDQDKPGPIATDLRRGGAAADSAHARDLNSGTTFRRGRMAIDGKLFGDFEYNVLMEFGGAGLEDAGHVHELWVQYSGLKPFHLRAGAFPPSMGLEDANSTSGMPFLERPAITDMARGLAAGDFREAVQLVANSDRWFASAAMSGRLVGVINSTGSPVTQPYDTQLGFVGRVAVVAAKGPDWLLHLGAHGSYAARPADAGGPDALATAARYPIQFRERPELRVDPTRLIDTGAIDARHASTAGLELAGQKKNFYLQAEYERLSIERRVSTLSNPHFSGWFVEGGWLLTGEARRYNTGAFAFDAPPVAHNFSLKDGGWGAWELALRYSDANLNYNQGAAGAAAAPDAVRGGEQKILTAGVNWYLNSSVRLTLDLQHTQVDRLSPSATAFATPAGAQIGQSFDALALRSQLAF